MLRETRMSDHKRLYIIPVFLALVLMIIGFSPVFASAETDAHLAIVVAQNKVGDCYQAALAAENSGANISSLLNTLNEAGMLLSKANLAYNAGDFSSAYNLASQSQEELNGFVAGANVLKDDAAQARYLSFMLNVVGSIGGTAIVIVGGLVLWILLNRRYEKNGSGAK